MLTDFDKAIIANLQTLPNAMLQVFTTMEVVNPLVQELCAQEWTARINAPEPTAAELSDWCSRMEIRARCQ